MQWNRAEWLAQMEGILQTLNEGVLIVDQCDGILFANQCIEELTGLRAAEVVGCRPDCFYSGADLEFLNQQITRSIETGRHRYEFFIPKKDGSRVPVIISSRSVPTPSGCEIGIVTFTDISVQKQAEARLSEANEKLEQRQREIEADLALASHVQQSLAPQAIRWGRIAVDTAYLPVRTIGGDIGLVSALDREHLNVLVCDVSGHGIGAALIANRIYSETISQLERGASLEQLLRRLNGFVLRHLDRSDFLFSLSVVQLDQEGRRMIYANAGHPPAFWFTSKGECRLLEARSTVLGCLENAVSSEPTEQVELNPGDRLMFYTDGLTDVFNEEGEMLGVAGLQEIARKAHMKPFAEMKQSILEGVASWRYEAPTDDVSLVLAEIQ
jgi:PAS domain S-box-containing protein